MLRGNIALVTVISLYATTDLSNYTPQALACPLNILVQLPMREKRKQNKKRYFAPKLYLRLPAITEKTLPEMLGSNLPNNVQASSFDHAAIQNGYKGMEKRRARCTEHGERPSVCTISPSVDIPLCLPRFCPLHPLLPSSCLASPSKEIHHSSCRPRRPSVMTSPSITWIRILLVRIHELPVVLL